MKKISIKRAQKYAKRGYEVVIHNGKTSVRKVVFTDEK